MFEAGIESAGLYDPITEGSTTVIVFSLKFRSTSFHFHGVVFAQWPIYPSEHLILPLILQVNQVFAFD
jgi:hypothetical protein